MTNFHGAWLAAALALLAPATSRAQAPGAAPVGTGTPLGTVVMVPFEPQGQATQAEADAAFNTARDFAMRLKGVNLLAQTEAENCFALAASQNVWNQDISGPALVKLQPCTQAGVFVVGVLMRTGTGPVTVTARLVDARSGNDVRRVQGILAGGDTDRASTLGGMVSQLLKPETHRGSLELVCPAAGVEVTLGTDYVGACQDRMRMDDLIPGTHVLRLKKGALAPAQRRVEVLFDRVTVVTITDVNGALNIQVEDVTRAANRVFTADAQPAAPSVTTPVQAVTPPPEKTPAQNAPAEQPRPTTSAEGGGGGMSPLVFAGAGVGALGAGVAFLGVGAAVVASALTLAWPRFGGITGRVQALPGEPIGLVPVRIWGTLAVVPVGALVLLVGLGILGAGVAVAVAGLVKGA